MTDDEREINTKETLKKILTTKRKGRKLRPGDLYGDSPSTDKEMFDRFIKALGVSEVISVRQFLGKPSSNCLWDPLPMNGLFDHFQAVRLTDGTVVIISFPYEEYKKGTGWRIHDVCEQYDMCCVIAKEYSWYWPGKTLPLIWAYAPADGDVLDITAAIIQRLNEGLVKE